MEKRRHTNIFYNFADCELSISDAGDLLARTTQSRAARIS